MTDNLDKKYIQYDHILPTASDIESLGKLFPINEFLKIINQFEIKSISFNPFDYRQMKNSEILTDFDDWLDNIRTLFFDLKFTYSYALFFALG